MIPTEFWAPEADMFCHDRFKGEHCTHCTLGWMDRLVGGPGESDPLDRPLPQEERPFIVNFQCAWRNEAEALGLVNGDYDIAVINDDASEGDLERCFKGALTRVGYQSHNGTNLYRREVTK